MTKKFNYDTPIQVPAGVRFLNDWDEFCLDAFEPKCIINKEIPGCGMTEYCIRSQEPIVLCSPRKMLLENKFNQHKDEVYLVRNEMDKDPGVDKDISKDSKTPKEKIITEEQKREQERLELAEKKRKNSEIHERIRNELIEYIDRRTSENKPFKILVTYDSYHIVRSILNEKYPLGAKYYTVIDEFQSILHDARFKSDTENRFLRELRKSKTSLFVSATPMLKEYMEMLEDFKDLPYYSLDWKTLDPTRIITPNLTVKTMRTVNEKAKEIINSYLDEKFEKVVVQRDGKPTEIISNEAVIYVNSVNQILNIIYNNKLKPDQVNILCADTDENIKRIHKKLTKKFDIGTVPLEGEPHKMFTFCTRTVYLGADFYSKCARTFIFSDANIDSLAVDISEDLPQILGRQRLTENPWHNSAEFYYKTTADYNSMEKEDFDNKLKEKLYATKDLLDVYKDGTSTLSQKSTLAKKYESDAKNSNYKNDYVAVNVFYDEITGAKSYEPIKNQLVYVNEVRAFNIQQIDYKDRFSVFAKVTKELTPDDIINQGVSDFLRGYQTLTRRGDKLRMLCELEMPEGSMELILNQLQDSDHVKSYYINLGPKRIKELGYNVTKMNKELGIIVFSPELLEEKIYTEFKEGDSFLLIDIKDKLTEIYSSINYQKTPKATDIKEFFETKDNMKTTLIEGKKKRLRGYELIKKLK